ncbi:HAMP domain-containing sensor histidine kinase [Clostridium sp. BJN0001]|uniref:sensor histidine kinase n=1 Tax=Clostridium sp. BJN0001 TaxID=2930219 RepID=UPI001FD09042|nr:HAMP domain-containing sensor histidine kinase [Clostridium sp. BJN0001]
MTYIFQTLKNNEMKRLTKKYIIISIIGISIIILFSSVISKEFSKILIKQNTIIFSEIIDENIDYKKIVENFINNNDIDEDNIQKSKDILKSYGYDLNISNAADPLKFQIQKMVLILFIPVFLFIILILYIINMYEFVKIYKNINKVSESISQIANGKIVKLQNEYDEGDISFLLSSVNLVADRVNNSISSLKNEKINLKDFLADISHQLKTPLSALIMFIDILRNNKNIEEEDRKKFLSECDEQLNRMQWLIMNLLKVGRLEANAIQFNIEKEQLKETIDISVAALKNMADSKNIKIDVKCDENCLLYHDKGWLAEAISNLIKNAIEHTKEGGKVEIIVSKGPIFVKIFIKDNGKGMSIDTQKNIFKRFYKGEDSTNPTSIGIGLSLSKSIIEKLNGRISVRSEIGKGTTFIIIFQL